MYHNLLKIKHIAVYLSLMIMVLVLSGCSSGILPEQYEQLKAELTSYQQKLAELETSYQQQLEDLNTKVEDLTQAKAAFEELADNSAKLNEELSTKVEDLTRAAAALEELADNSAKLNEELSTIAAYSLWYDYYYATGAYNFEDVALFNSQLGNLVTATGDAASQAALDIYYQADNEYQEVVASLPPDNVWTMPQYENWRDAGEARKEALGQVGGHLLDKVKTIAWFGVD